MQVNLPRGGLAAPVAAPTAASVAANAVSESVENKKVQEPAVATAATSANGNLSETEKADMMDKEKLKEVLGRTLDVIEQVMPSCEVRYQVIEDADMVQVQVVNKNDGEVIRKIPADKVIEMVKRIHQILTSEQDPNIIKGGYACLV